MVWGLAWLHSGLCQGKGGEVPVLLHPWAAEPWRRADRERQQQAWPTPHLRLDKNGLYPSPRPAGTVLCTQC